MRIEGGIFNAQDLEMIVMNLLGIIRLETKDQGRTGKTAILADLQVVLANPYILLILPFPDRICSRRTPQAVVIDGELPVNLDARHHQILHHSAGELQPRREDKQPVRQRICRIDPRVLPITVHAQEILPAMGDERQTQTIFNREGRPEKMLSKLP